MECEEEKSLRKYIKNRMSLFKDKIKFRIEDYDYVSNFNDICESIKKLDKQPTPEMLEFMKFDIQKIQKEIEPYRIRDIYNKISIFNNKFNNKIEDYDYISNFYDICESIKKLDEPTVEMLEFMKKIDDIKNYDGILRKINNIVISSINEQYVKIKYEISKNIFKDLLNDKLRMICIDVIQNWFATHVTYKGEPYKIDTDQAEVVFDIHKNLLVRALAGSGKTRTLVAKIIYLVSICGMDENEIIAFVFNGDASKEINNRLKEMNVDGKQIITKPIASTFHSFAYNNTMHNKILVDGVDNQRKMFIQEIIKNNVDYGKVYTFFKKEATKIGREQFSSNENFYMTLRAQQYATLDGKKVKSFGEKIISDFLFEHGIEYEYESGVYTNNLSMISKSENLFRDKTEFKPDFLLTKENIVWEHWAITGEETLAQIEQINRKGVIGTYEEYKENMEWKRAVYAKTWIDESKPANKWAQKVKDWKNLIETHYDENLSREEFESKIQEILNANGIKTQKLSQKELIKKVWDKQTNKFTELVVRFIDNLEQKYIQNLQKLEQKISGIPEDTRERVFLDVGLQVYKLYREKLNNNPNYDMDFNILMDKVSLDMKNNENICTKIKNTKYILIDEFQDFSKLFMNFIYAVKQINPYIKIMCVGDGYQAINRFAGSDIKYFTDFKKYFEEDSNVLDINTNYRCAKSIVYNARDFLIKKMSVNTGFKANKTNNGNVVLLDVNKVFIEYRSEKEQQNKDTIFKKNMIVSENRAPEKTAVQYLKAVAWIIGKHKDKQSIKILHRNNDTSFWFINLDVFYNRLKETCDKMNIISKEDFDKKVSIGTMHKAKGLEAQVVILLEIENKIIPAMHPDNSLFQIFDETPEVVFEDQKRLFYVALTRAEEDLYILYNGNFKSEFLKNLSAPKELELSDKSKCYKDIRFDVF